MNPVEFAVTLFKGKKAVAHFLTQDENLANERSREWRATGEDYTCMVEKREPVLSSGNERIATNEYLTQASPF